MKHLLLTVLVIPALAALSACDNGKSKGPDSLKENLRGVIVHNMDDGQAMDEGNWYVQDPELDGVEGVSSEKTIAEFGLKNEKEIIVAVLDSGVDVQHEDLQGKIWMNPGESGVDANGNDKASNGIDDDNNGYIDDINGWNFLGGKDGRHVNEETLEVTRELVRFEARLAKGEVLSAEEKLYLAKVQAAYTAEHAEATRVVDMIKPDVDKMEASKKVLKDELGLEDYSKEALDAIDSKNASVMDAKAALLAITAKYRSVDRLGRIQDYYSGLLKYYLNKDFNPRSEIVGDDPSDFTDTDYGNNDVQGPDAGHGTHVSGIIAAVRNNGLGVNGVAENVKIMALRMVPNGDERDKDIYLAVKYAVDNGAHIINMSFGKSFSPYKSKVDEAFLYAAEKGVLVFHSAGNGSSNNDLVAGYPNRTVADAVVRGLPAEVPTWMEIGASAKIKGLDMVADFSDYGKMDVDLFSPGHEINSTVPDNKYAVYSGTSMAGPCAAGVGALLMSNFPNMTAMQAKAIIRNEVRMYPDLKVRLPGSDTLDLPVLFEGLSSTGGIIDAFSSVSLAKQLSDN